MKKWFSKKLSISFVISLALVVTLFSVIYASNFQNQKQARFNFPMQSDDMYQYPITPDDQVRWKDLGTRKKRLEMCQVPERNLENMSTQGLVETCLNYPFMIDLFLFNTLQEGYNRMEEDFNGLQMLRKRRDAGTELLKLYSSISLDELSKNDMFPAIRLSYIETMLVQESIFNTLSEKEIKTLIKECFEKEQLISEKYSDIYGCSTTGRLILKCLHKIDNDFIEIVNTCEEMKNFITTGTIISKNIDAEVLSEIDNYIYENYGQVSAQQVTRDDPFFQFKILCNVSQVTTPRGVNVQAFEWVSGDYNANQRQQINSLVKYVYPDVQIVGDPTTKYNCHSYAWYSQSTANRFWINNPTAYFSGTNRSYNLIINSHLGYIPSSATTGAKVYYVNGDHSAIVWTRELFLSKWGTGPVVAHRPYQDPYSPTSFSYYTYRY